MVIEVVIPNVKYNNAVALVETEQYEEAIAIFETLDEDKYSSEQIAECNYLFAVALMETGQYEEAIATFEALDGYNDSIEQITECNYRFAVALMNAERYEEAIATFEALDEYKDSVELAGLSKINNIYVGDSVYFGTYEMFEDTSYYSKGNIEWLVLDKQDRKLLVISKYALDCQLYNTETGRVTWEICSMRQWLNKEFINSAFNAEEQAVISTVTVSADNNPDYGTDSGNATQDKVFLLSITEVNKYFSSDSARQCQATEYAVANGAHVNSVGNCSWWLRSPGYFQSYAAIIYNDGVAYEFGNVVDSDAVAVRPALWIDLDSWIKLNSWNNPDSWINLDS